jgi:hypothetical protein
MVEILQLQVMKFLPVKEGRIFPKVAPVKKANQEEGIQNL